MHELKLYSILTKHKEVFVPIQPGHVGVYVCGPTVYWFAHIGNMRSYIFSDLLHRTLLMNGLKVKLIMNITDVGHLTDDEDAGEDKMIVAMRREGKTAHDIAAFYAEAFFKDIARLNILPAAAYPKATDHISDQIGMILELESNGFTYRTSDGIYFDTSKLPQYGALSGQRAGEKRAGARVEMGEKKHSTDFALWKFSVSDASPSTGSGHQPKRLMEWDSPWGVGFPGWHIECSAMSEKYLGVPFDIHTGGVDHIAVHHENELAQTRGARKELQANIWMHGEFLTVDGGKMSKSLGNVYTLDDLADKGFDPLAFRFFTLGAHYRSKMNFTFDALQAAQNALRRLQEEARAWDQPAQPDETYSQAFLHALNDDLDLPKALALTWKLVEDKKLNTSEKSATLLKFDEVLGLGLAAYVAKPVEVPTEVQVLADERHDARAKKDFAGSDALRDQIAALGWNVEDTKDGQRLTPKS